MCNKFLIDLKWFPTFSFLTLLDYFLPSCYRPIYMTSHLPPPPIFRLLLNMSTYLSADHVFHPTLYPLHGAINAITAPSNILGHFLMRASLSQGPRRSRLLDLTIASDILALKKTHNSEYSHFILNLSSAANFFCADKASAPGTPSIYNTIGVKCRLRSRQDWRYRYFLYFSAFAKILFGRHAKVGSRIEVDNSNVKHRSGTLLPESVGAYFCPWLCRYFYMSRPPHQISHPIPCPSI